MKRVLLCWLVALAVPGAIAQSPPALAVPGAIAQSLPALDRVPLPESLRPKRVIDDGRIDGRPMALHSVESSQPCDELLPRVRQLWRARLSPHVLLDAGGRWTVVSAALPDGFITLQMQVADSGGCEGFMSRWPFARQRADQAAARVREWLPNWPAEVKVLRQTEERSASGTGGSITGQSALAVPRLLTLFRERVEAQGYRVQEVIRAPGATPLTQSVLVARKAGVELSVFLNANDDLTDVVLILDRSNQ